MIGRAHYISIALFGVIMYSVLVSGQQQQGFIRVEPVSELCLGCICEAVSNCNRTLGCSGDVCGIFRITWAYWSDSGKPVLEGDDPKSDGAYARCTTDPVCAAKAVTGYMARFAQDCNRDGVIDCTDYAAIHRLGGYGCSGQLDAAYGGKFSECQRQVAQIVGSSGGILNSDQVTNF